MILIIAARECNHSTSSLRGKGKVQCYCNKSLPLSRQGKSGRWGLTPSPKCPQAGFQTCYSFGFCVNHIHIFFFDLVKCRWSDSKFRFFFLFFEFRTDFQGYFGGQIQTFFCIFRLFLTFIQILCPLKVAGLEFKHRTPDLPILCSTLWLVRCLS